MTVHAFSVHPASPNYVAVRLEVSEDSAACELELVVDTGATVFRAKSLPETRGERHVSFLVPAAIVDGPSVAYAVEASPGGLTDLPHPRIAA
jgi:hypothetical protein